MEYSGEDFNYHDQQTNERFIPYCIEPSVGVDRLMLAFLIDSYDEEELEDGSTRTVMRLHPVLAPFKAAVLPLSKKLSDEARDIYLKLAKYFPVDFDETGSIGKRYRRHDEIGTPYCITYDFDSREDSQVTIRHRDTMEQIRIPIDQLVDFLQEKINY